VWGILLAKSQSMLFVPDPNEIQRRASNIGIYFLLMGIGAGFSNLFMNWGVAEVLRFDI
jgi:hypothetical protein